MSAQIIIMKQPAYATGSRRESWLGATIYTQQCWVSGEHFSKQIHIEIFDVERLLKNNSIH